MQLKELGWDGFFDESFDSFRGKGLSPMRIIRDGREIYRACGEEGELTGELSGRLRFQTERRDELPVVGDWVAASPRTDEGKAVIQELLPRKTVFSRKVAGETTQEQVLAANIDTAFIVCGLDLNFNIRRIERYLSLAWDSGAVPVVLLNKADICPEAEARKNEVLSIAIGVDVHTLSAVQNDGLDFLHQYLPTGKTAVFLGSSGVGKSTIINSLLGDERLRVGEVKREGSRGRHTTTFRELLFIAGGGMVIDTPGIRELQVWGDEEGLKQVFDDIEELSLRCKFRDCTHKSEPECAVLDAVRDGVLDEERLQSYLKLKREFAYLADRQTMKPAAVEKARWKSIKKAARRFFKEENR